MNAFKITVQALIFVFLFQTFFYVKEYPVPYFLTKIALPGIGMMLAGLLFLIHQKNDRSLSNAGWLTILFATYFISFGCLAAYVFYRQPMGLVLTSQAKILPFFVFFLAYYLAWLLRPTAKTLFQALFLSGVLLAAGFIYASKAVDAASMWTQGSTLYTSDAKGIRIVFPAALVGTAYFACLHYLRYKMSYVVIAAWLLITYFLVFDLKQRMELLAIMLATLSALAGKKWASVINMSFFMACVGVVLLVAFYSEFAPYTKSFTEDTSWIARMRQANYVSAVFLEEPWTIPFGVGKMSEVGSYGYEEHLGFAFTTADLGWLGMVHEYGLVGTAVLIAMIAILYRGIPSEDRLTDVYAVVVSNAFRSYFVMTIFLSVLAPRFLYLSGVFFAIYGYSLYLTHRYSPAPGDIREASTREQ